MFNLQIINAIQCDITPKLFASLLMDGMDALTCLNLICSLNMLKISTPEIHSLLSELIGLGNNLNSQDTKIRVPEKIYI